MILYRAFYPSAAKLRKVFGDLLTELRTGCLGPVELDANPKGWSVTRDAISIGLCWNETSEVSGLALAEGSSAASLDLKVGAMVPEAVALCWEVLLVLETVSPSEVWLSDATYAEEADRSGGIPLMMDDVGAGHFLSTVAFDRLVKTLTSGASPGDDSD